MLPYKLWIQKQKKISTPKYHIEIMILSQYLDHFFIDFSLMNLNLKTAQKCLMTAGHERWSCFLIETKNIYGYI